MVASLVPVTACKDLFEDAPEAAATTTGDQKATPTVAEPPVAAEPPAAPEPTAAEALAAELAEPDWVPRLGAAGDLAQGKLVPPGEAAELILEALEREIADPLPGGPPYSTYLPVSGWLRSNYTRMLGEMGAAFPDARAKVEAAAQGSGEVQQRAQLALGYAGDRNVIDPLREILRTAKDGDLRTDAAYLLGQLEATEARAELEAALADGFSVNARRIEGAPPLYPVRDQALGALEALGATVEIEPDGTYELAPP